jgi:uncharacterized protein (DUF2236 family)
MTALADSPQTDLFGLFGPESVSWRVHADPVLVLAGLRALLLQALHPRAMAGVAAHSGFRSDPWGRLRRTAEYVGATTYGTATEARRAGARVRGVHRRLSATDPETGEPFRIDDPELLTWVYACEVDSFLSTARRAGARISDADADRYFQEQLTSAELVGLDPAEVPQDRAELATYFQTMRPQLRTTAEARSAAAFVLVPPMPAWVRLGTPARPAWAALAGLSFGLLPAWARRMYGIPTVPLGEVATTTALRGLRRSLLLIPPGVREGPAIKAARARNALTGPIG